MTRKTCVLTWAQNNTSVHAGFWDTLLTYCQHNDAELGVIPGHYQLEAEEPVWDSRVVPYFGHCHKRLCKYLVVRPELRTAPTAVKPLSGLAGFASRDSMIMGHPSFAWETVPSSTGDPRVMFTTGACTEPNYSQTKAGARAETVHALGAVVIEFGSQGYFHVRHLEYREGYIQDLTTVYRANQVSKAPVEVLHLGDWHDAKLGVQEALNYYRLARLLEPRSVRLDDFFDMQSNNHHTHPREVAMGARGHLRDELMQAAERLTTWSRVCKEVLVVRSNHDEALDRWMRDASPWAKPEDLNLFVQLWQKKIANPFEWEGAFPEIMRMMHVPDNVQFLQRDSVLRRCGVDMTQHGDKGVNGSRGSLASFARMGEPINIGHSHTPGIQGRAWQTGVATRGKHGYNEDSRSTWLRTHCLVYANGARSFLTILPDDTWCSSKTYEKLRSCSL